MRVRHFPLSAVLLLVWPLVCFGVVAQAQDTGSATGRDKTQDKTQDTGDQKKVRDARFKAKGWVQVENIWVAKEFVKDAKKGIYHHDGKVVNSYEIRKLQSGMVRHPLTKQFIAAADMGKARTQFPLADGAWGSREEANKYHADQSRPWIVRTSHCNVASTLPIDTILYKVVGQVDSACTRLASILGGATPPPTRRPTILVLPNRAAYTTFGANNGDGGSSHGAFLTPQFTFSIDGSTSRVGVALWDKDWGPYYVRHAAALALNCSILGDETDDTPQWFQRALGGYVERHFSPGNAKYFGGQHVRKGGVKNLGKWLAEFQIGPDQPERGVNSVEYNVYQAGLLLSFAMRGGSKSATTALEKVTTAYAKGSKQAVAVKRLGKVLAKQEAEVKAYLEKIVR